MANNNLTIEDIAEIYDKSLDDDSYYQLLVKAYNKFTKDIKMEEVGDSNGR